MSRLNRVLCGVTGHMRLAQVNQRKRRAWEPLAFTRFRLKSIRSVNRVYAQKIEVSYTMLVRNGGVAVRGKQVLELGYL
jgi:hypothetical protein